MVSVLQPKRVTPAKAGTHEHGAARYSGRRRSWAPALAGVTPMFFAPLLAACQQAEAPANQVAAAPPQKAAPETDVGAAQRLVRARIASGGDIRFLGVTRSASKGVPIVCGSYEQAGRRQRYIVVNREDVFVEPQMRPGQMDGAVAEFCREGHDNGPATATPVTGNGQ